MKRLIFILLYFFSLQSNGQVVAIQNDGERPVIYLCFENRLTVAVEHCSSSLISLSTDNGKISGNHGHFEIVPDHAGLATIFVKRKTWKGEKIIDSSYFRVKGLPVGLSLAGKIGGEITKSLLCVLIAPSAIIECGGCVDGRFPIVNFKIIVQREKQEIFKRTLLDANGARIDSVTNNFFLTLNNNDKVLFTDITIKDCDGTTRLLDSMEFTITGTENYKKTLPDEDIINVDPVSGTEVRLRRSELFPK